MQRDPTIPTDPPLARFGHDGAFYADLKQRAEAYFEGSGRRRRDVGAMYLKTAVILTWFVGSWALLVFFATAAWQGVLLAISLGLSIATIGMSVQHDANHGAYSSHRWVNRTLGFTLDVMGVCGYFWRQKHNIIHHTFTNVQGVDFDLDFGTMARLSPEQPRLPWHRYQQYYLWFLYGFLLPKWVFHDDFVLLRHMRAGPHKLPKMGRLDHFLFYAWKVFFVGWSLVIPAFYHPIWQVIIFHLIAAYTVGITLSPVFQLAHCVDAVTFPEAPEGAGTVSEDWAAHQVGTTLDFAPKHWGLTWLLGGLNFQVEHHLFPRVCHVHYPALARLVRETAEDHGVQYRCHTTLQEAIESHFRHLAKLGSVEG